MHDCKVKLKDGTTYCAPKWSWCPKDGYFTILNTDGGSPIRINFADCVSAIELGQRTKKDLPPQDVDLLARARNEGWSDMSTPHE